MLPPPASPRANVLVVDDDAGVRDVCTTLLHALGYRARGAGDSRQALQRLSDDGVQVVMADLEMPCVQDGSLLRALKREHPQLRVLLMAGRPHTDLARFSELADAVIQKPFRMGELDQGLDLALAAS